MKTKQETSVVMSLERFKELEYIESKFTKSEPSDIYIKRGYDGLIVNIKTGSDAFKEVSELLKDSENINRCIRNTMSDMNHLSRKSEIDVRKFKIMSVYDFIKYKLNN